MSTLLSVDATTRKDEIMQRVKLELAAAQAQELISVSRSATYPKNLPRSSREIVSRKLTKNALPSVFLNPGHHLRAQNRSVAPIGVGPSGILTWTPKTCMKRCIGRYMDTCKWKTRY